MNKKFLKRQKSEQLQKTASLFIQIGQLLQQGYPLNTALTFIMLHVSAPTKVQIQEVLEQLKAGHPAYKAFYYFDIPPSFKSFLYFYEQQGNLAEGFIHAGSLLDQREKMKNEVVKLLRYPFFLLWICFLLLTLMYRLVVPHFRSFFSMMNDVPFLTKIVFRFLDYIPYICASFAMILVGGTIYIYFKVKVWSSYRKIMALLSFPFLREFVQITVTYYFALQLGNLLKAGLPLQEALRLFKSQDYLPFYQQECTQIMNELQQGHTFSSILVQKKYFREQLAFVVENGEKTGYLAKDLVHYSEMLYSQLDGLLRKMLRYISPVFFLIIGGIVFLLFLATMLPLFQMVGAL
ncbi:type II secretion system F family protein [bacterium LRH843]|nr:type II secretion system F family protein [bacterium LRH843]